MYLKIYRLQLKMVDIEDVAAVEDACGEYRMLLQLKV